MKRRYRLVAVGGTFDSLHRGHKILLRRAFRISDKVIIGLSSDSFAKRLRKPHKVDAYRKRRRELVAFLQKLRIMSRAQIVPLNDHYGPTVVSSKIEAVLVGRDTLASARRINVIRRRKRLKPLNVLVVPTVPAEDFKPVSTTRIRGRIMDREGYLT